MQFATNHLGHFALAVGLHDALAAGAARADRRRSAPAAHLRSPVVFDDIHFAFRAYEPIVRLRAVQDRERAVRGRATRRWADDGITANAVMPGRDHATDLQRHLDRRPGRRSSPEMPQDAAAGRRDLVLVATSPLLDGIGGRYFEDCNESAPVARRVGFDLVGVAPYALDPENADRLWELVPARRARRDGLVREQVGVDRHQPVDVVDVAVEVRHDDRVAARRSPRAGARSPRRRARRARAPRRTRARPCPRAASRRAPRSSASASASRRPPSSGCTRLTIEAAERHAAPRAACRGRRSPPRPARARAR